jgi:hypothetical protein
VEELALGDEVVVVDPATLATSTSRIVAVRVSQRECGTLRHAGGELCVTTDHPIYDPDARAFFPAGDWLLGARKAVLIAGAERVQRDVLTAVEVFTRVDDVFDLTVEHEWHTFVADGIVVHNKSPPCSVPSITTCSCTVGAGPGRAGVPGTGTLVCDSQWGSADCVQCRPIGGNNDAGVDGGVSDGGLRDGGGEVDGGEVDGGEVDGGEVDAGADGG